MALIKRIFGIITLLIGISIIGWFIYNQFAPTEMFVKTYQGIVQLILPILMIVYGWKWTKNS